MACLTELPDSIGRMVQLYLGVADGMSIARVWACRYSKMTASPRYSIYAHAYAHVCTHVMHVCMRMCIDMYVDRYLRMSVHAFVQYEPGHYDILVIITC